MVSPIEMNIRVSIRQGGYGQGLELSEDVKIDASTFLDVCEVLAQFHALAEKLKTKAKT